MESQETRERKVDKQDALQTTAQTDKSYTGAEIYNLYTYTKRENI